MEQSQSIAQSKPSKVVKHFLPGDVCAQFSAGFLDEDVCREKILRMLHPVVASCPGCGEPIRSSLRIASFWKGRRVKCSACEKFFVSSTGTFLAGTHMNYREIVLLAFFLSLDLPLKKIGLLLGISQETVRLWKIKFDAFNDLQEGQRHE